MFHNTPCWRNSTKTQKEVGTSMMVGLRNVIKMSKDIIKNLVTGSARQKLKEAFLLSASSSSAARKQHTALTWQEGSVPLSMIIPW